jgi:acetyl-CoA decarbonylase/synthase complex subunit gamma
MRYAVEPGLYAIGDPTPESPVFVSANYKLSFDHLRRGLAGVDGWILVLDTRGVNVWCAAGKGTFGTAELVTRIRETRLDEIVTHRELIVPQLGATGVAAHLVRQASGFRVVYGPVRAGDIAAFLAAGKRATPEMRRVRFDLADRLAVVPVELVQWGRYAVPIALALGVSSGLHRGGFSGASLVAAGPRAAALIVSALLAGAVLTPVLLPWLPGRAFTVKGATLGAVLAAVATALGWPPHGVAHPRVEAAAWLLVLPAISGFVALNYTGASTFTSLSGVKQEMRYAIPAMIVAAAAGLGLWLLARFLA